MSTQLLKELSNYLDGELDAAEQYARTALRCKEYDSILANTLIELAETEISHSTKIHEQVARILDTENKKQGEVSIAMKVVYDYLREVHIDKTNKVRWMINQYIIEDK